MEEHRINNETLEESKISSLIEFELKELGYLIVQVKINSHERALQIMMERISGELNINDCTNASRVIMPVIESNRLLPDNYRIEISSPGIDRILVRKKDFIQNIDVIEIYKGYILSKLKLSLSSVTLTSYFEPAFNART